MSFIRGVLLVGKFRSQQELNGMTNDDQRNTLIVEMAGRTNQPIAHFQSLDDVALAGAGAILVFLREAGIRDDAALKTMSDDDQRNTAIVELAAQTHLGVPQLQGLSSLDLVRLALGGDLGHSSGGHPGAPQDPGLDDNPRNGDGGQQDPSPEEGSTQNPGNVPGCFHGETPVLMANGQTKTIEAIVVGDQVMARDETTGITATGTVAQVFRHRVGETLLLQTEGEGIVETTAAHRFAVADGGFVSAGELRPGDRISTYDDHGVEVVSTGTRLAKASVYNLSVDRLHTFFIGGAGLWVHNDKKSDPEDPPVHDGNP